MAEKLTVLIIEDDPDGMESVSEAVESAGFRVLKAVCGNKGVELFREARPQVVLSDLVMPDIDGIRVLEQCREIDASVPFIMMTAYGSVDSSVKALRNGAYDYIQKPLNLDELEATLRRAAETSRLRRRIDDLAASIRDKFSVHAMVAESEKMRSVLRQVEAVADTSATVMIRGESGTGKELVAKALHADSSRNSGPFVAVNCGAFSESLLESELFGHEKGAFTGAVSKYAGAFERADGGTLFLDEIGDAPASVQIKLLRALEEREIRRIGGEKPFKVDVRIVSATNRDLEDMIASGSFREDLFYRLQVVSIAIPPLRERISDIRPLAERFIAQAVTTHSRVVKNVTSGFYKVLEAFNWPGNIRQLRNVVESAVLLCTDGILDENSPSLPKLAGSSGSNGFVVPENMTFEELEREIFRQVLARNAGNRSITAEQLGLSRRTVQRKASEFL